MKKKAQVTIFIIVAIILVVSVLGFLAFRSGKNLSENSLPVYTEDFPVYVQTCLAQVSDQAVTSIGKYGGDYILPKNSISFSSYFVPLYINKNVKNIPNESVLEDAINNYVEDELDSCFDNFTSFRESGFEIQEGELNVRSEIKDDRVVVDAKLPLTVSKGDVQKQYSTFGVVVKPVRILEILKLANEIADEQINDSRSVCINCVSDKADNYNLSINVFETDNNNEFIYTLTDPFSNFTGISYNFSFGARYDFPVCKTMESCFYDLS